MEESPFLPLPQEVLIDHVEQTATSLTVTVVSTRTEAVCPGCKHTSEHIHSQYQRTVRDVPSGGRKARASALRSQVLLPFPLLPTKGLRGTVT